MLKNLIILPDGTEIFSESTRDNAIISCTFTQSVNAESELSPGSVCSNELDMRLFAPNGALSISAGTEIAYYKVDGTGTRTKIGLYTMEKPTRSGSGTYRFCAYDRVSWLDKDLTEWLATLDGWPYRLADFAQMVCAACGLTLSTEDVPNGDYLIKKVTGGTTGRTLMQSIAQIACRFVRADADGNIEFAWYTDKGKKIDTSGAHHYFGGGLSYEDYQTKQIQKVQIQANEDDNGTVYPDGTEEELNTFKVTGNPLLSAETGDELKPVAQVIFEQLQDVAYTPCKVSIQATTDINAGDIVHITDRNGVTITAYVMTKTNKGQKDTLECTGSARRDSTTATNELSLKAVNGKVLNLTKSVDGLKIENADTAGRVASLEMNVETVSAQVSKQEQDTETLSQSIASVKIDSDKIALSVASIEENGTGKLSNQFGMTIDGSSVDIDRDGAQLHNTLDETGMYVRSKTNDEIIMQAAAGGVETINLTARQYFTLGGRTRREIVTVDGEEWEACYWIGG